jgi:hypothetical protein
MTKGTRPKARPVSIAKDAGMQLLKTPEVVQLLEEGCDEELYVMRSAELTPSLAVGDAGNPESEVVDGHEQRNERKRKT